MTDRGDVLVVDDDADIAEALLAVLQLSGYEARRASNGLEALAAVAERRPAVVLLDMRMPVMDGWECGRELRARYGRDLPIVVFTAAEHARARGEQIGADAVLAKPFEVPELLRVVSEQVERSTSNLR